MTEQHSRQRAEQVYDAEIERRRQRLSIKQALHSATMHSTLASLKEAAGRNDWAKVQDLYIDLQLEPGSNTLDRFGFDELTQAVRLRDAERVVAAVDALTTGGGSNPSA